MGNNAADVFGNGAVINALIPRVFVTEVLSRKSCNYMLMRNSRSLPLKTSVLACFGVSSDSCKSFH